VNRIGYESNVMPGDSWRITELKTKKKTSVLPTLAQPQREGGTKEPCGQLGTELMFEVSIRLQGSKGDSARKLLTTQMKKKISLVHLSHECRFLAKRRKKTGVNCHGKRASRLQNATQVASFIARVDQCTGKRGVSTLPTVVGTSGGLKLVTTSAEMFYETQTGGNLDHSTGKQGS